MKWYSKTTYVDQQTGEILTKEQVEKDFIIKKKIKTYEKKWNWSRPNWNGTKSREEYGIITIICTCDREGKQLKLF